MHTVLLFFGPLGDGDTSLARTEREPDIQRLLHKHHLQDAEELMQLEQELKERLNNLRVSDEDIEALEASVLEMESLLVKAAEERDIPWLRLNRYSLVQFGHGRYQQRIQATTTTRTSNIAVELAGDG